MPHKDPEARRAWDREYRRRTRGGGGKKSAPPTPVPVRLRSALDVVLVVEGQVGLLLGEPKAHTLERANPSVREVCGLSHVGSRCLVDWRSADR